MGSGVAADPEGVHLGHVGTRAENGKGELQLNSNIRRSCAPAPSRSGNSVCAGPLIRSVKLKPGAEIATINADDGR